MKRALPLAVFALSAGWLFITGSLDGDFRIDEAHKVSETYFLRLIERGDFTNPDWLASPVERANPPVGKVVFGVAIQLAGLELPADASFAAHPDPRGRPPAFRPALLPVRIISLLATAGTAALLCVLASPLASILYMGSFAARTYGASGVYDALLAFFIVASAVPVASKVNWPRTVVSAVLAALAFGTRASGLLALAGVIVLLRDWKKAVAAIAICFGLATAINPVYWVPGPEPLPLRVIDRYAMQFRDLNNLLVATGEHRLGLIEKWRFVAEYAFGDLLGALTLLGLALLALQARDAAVRRAPVLYWCLAIALLFTLWIPVAYPRYVLAVIPAFAIAADYGWRSVVTKVSTSLREKANGSSTG